MAKLSLNMLVALSTCAMAMAYNRPAATKDFGEIDADASGHATHEEVDAHLDRQFQKEMDAWLEFYDTNKDGKVHKDEYFALPKSNQRYWDSVDINNDDYTGPSEMRINRDRSHPKRVDTYIQYYDANSDGHVHKHEFVAKHKEL